MYDAIEAQALAEFGEIGIVGAGQGSSEVVADVSAEMDEGIAIDYVLAEGGQRGH